MQNKLFIRTLTALALCGTLLLCACEGGNTPADTTSGELPADTTTTGEPEKTVLEVAVDGEAKLSIVRAEKTSDAIEDSCTALRKNMSNWLKANFLLTEDWVRPGEEIPADAAEILVGETNRPASAAALAALPADSYTIQITEQQIIIIGTDDNMTAYALYDFETNYLLNSAYKTESGLAIPIGTDKLVTAPERNTTGGILASGGKVVASISTRRVQPKADTFTISQGAATDGTYFYIILMKKVSGVETGIIVKRRMDDWSEVAVSEELPLDHANDMCYNSRENILVVTNMSGQKLTVIDPETLTVIKQTYAGVEGTPYAIAYNAQRDCYCIAAGGKLNICNSNFIRVSTISMHTESDYIGQGMDADDDYIYMPLSGNSSKGTTDNIIIVYSWDTGFKRVVHLDTAMESETLMNWGGKYYINFNNDGSKVYDITYNVVYN